MNKHSLFFLFSFLLCFGISSFTMASSKPVHVFITAGQSNTDGRVNNALLPAYIKAFATDTVTYSAGQYPYCKLIQNNTNGKFSPFWPKGRNVQNLWAYDAVTYHLIGNALKEDFYVVKWAVGGTSIAFNNESATGRYWYAQPDWIQQATSTQNGGHSLLLSFIEAIDAAIDQTLSKIEQGYHIDAFIWHQGESDGKLQSNYYNDLKNVVSYVRNHLTQKTGENYMNLPFIFGTVSHSSQQYAEKVETAMQKLADEDPNAYLIDMSEGELLSDHLHFNEVSSEYLGREVFSLLDKLLDLSGTGFRVAKYKGDKKAAISYTFDDGLVEQYTIAAPHLEKLGFLGTFWINGGRVNENENAITDTTRVTWGQLKMLSDRGHEISNHGWLHRNFGKFPVEEIRRDIQRNDTAILTHIGIMPVTFCYPNNNSQGEGGVIAAANRVGTRKYQIAVGGKSTATSLDEWVRKLITTEDWGVGMTHGINYGYDCFKDPNILWNHLEKVKAQEDQIWVGTFREVSIYTQSQKHLEYEVDNQAKELVITPRLDLNQDLFAGTLTAILDPSIAKKVTVTQGKKKLKTQILSDKILFEFDPFGEPIHIKKR